MGDKDETDFLWQCALSTDHSYRHELEDITPDREDSPTQFLDATFCPVSLEIIDDDAPNGTENLEVMIREIREYGVLDTIGGEVWEASIILSSYFILYPSTWSKFSMFLELGCGVGLPSLVLCKLLLKLKSKCVTTHVIVSDNDVRVLSNIISIIKNQFSTSQISPGSFINSHVLKIDWNDFKDENFDLKFIPASDSLFAFGAALCYSSYHEVLADVINSFMKRYSLQEFILLQISDRVGFDKFLKRLQHFGITYILESIPQECYDYAKYAVKSEKCNSPDGFVTKIYSFPYTLPAQIDFCNHPKVFLSTPKESFVLLKCKLL